MAGPYWDQEPNVVVLGGGTGSFMLLSSLKRHTRNITALVNMADDGGSTGTLRDELGALPPGDVRQCLVALSDTPHLRELFNYRFEDGSLKGHAFGNLFLTALEKMTGNFAEGVEVASRVLNITGRVEPITLSDVRLAMRDTSGEVIKGEFAIAERVFDGQKLDFWLEPDPIVNPQAIEAIKQADIVVVAPGNLYGSLAPTLIVPGISKVLQESKATKVYVCNLVTKPGQTDGFKVSDFADEIERFLGYNNVLDFVLYNTAKPPRKLLEKYARDGELAVGIDQVNLQKASYTAVGKPLLGSDIVEKPANSKADPIAHSRTLIRHDSEAVASALVDLIGK